MYLVVILVRRSWMIYLSCLIISVVTAFFKGGFISSMIFYMLIIFLIVNFAHVFFTYTFFKMEQKLDKRSYVKGEFISFAYQIHNMTWLAFCPMRIYFCGDQILFKGNQLVEPYDLILGPSDVKKTMLTLECKYRGSYFAGIDKIVIRDYFDLFRFNFTSMEKLKIIVYPLIRDIRKLSVAANLSEATESVLNFEKYDASLFSSVRDYMPGDPLKSIHWKLSSKYNHLITKEFEGNVNNKSKILLNTESLGFSFEENIIIEEYLIEATVAMTKFLLENNTAVELSWYKFERKKEQGNTLRDFAKIYDALTYLVFSKGLFLKEILMREMENDKGHSNYMIITPYITKETSEYLLIKKRQNFTINIFIIDTQCNEYADCLNKYSIEPMIELISKGISVYKLIFENGQCRMEVVS